MPTELLPVCFMRQRAEAKASYEEVKTALSTYPPHSTGYGHKFYAISPEVNESSVAYSNHAKHYLTKWVDLSKIDKSFEALRDSMLVDKLLHCQRGRGQFYHRKNDLNLDGVDSGRKLYDRGSRQKNRAQEKLDRTANTSRSR